MDRFQAATGTRISSISGTLGGEAPKGCGRAAYKPCHMQNGTQASRAHLRARARAGAEKAVILARAGGAHMCK